MSEIDRDEFEALKREVRYLRDRQEILDLVNTYCRGLDRLDPDLIAAAFHPDAIDNHYDFFGGVEAFVPYAIEVESRLAGTHHGISTHLCEIDGDTAHAESYVHFFLRRPDGRTASIGSGRYIDRLERRDGAWRIAVRQILMDTHSETDGTPWARNAHLFQTGSRDRDDPSYQRPFDLPEDMKARAGQGSEAVRKWSED